MKMPEDYANGVQGLIEDSEAYPDLTPLQQRRTTEVKLKSPNGDDDAALALKYGYSKPIAQVSQMTQKMYGYLRDGNVQSHLEQSAVNGTNALHDLIIDAPCLNRQGRYDEEEERAKQWLKLIEQSPQGPTNADGEEEPGTDFHAQLDDLLNRWSAANAFMLQARLVEEQRGIAAAEHLYEEYTLSAQQLDEIRMEASKLPPAYNMLYLCRVRQFEIMRERTFDLSMGYPSHDLTDVKRKIAEGHDIHDLVPLMAWPFKEGYNLVMGSMMDGEAHRTLLSSMIAGQLPAQPMPWGMPQGYWPGMANGGQPQEDGDNEDGPPDKRPALFKLFGQRAAQEPPKAKPRHRRRSRRGRQK